MELTGLLAGVGVEAAAGSQGSSGRFRGSHMTTAAWVVVAWLCLAQAVEVSLPNQSHLKFYWFLLHRAGTVETIHSSRLHSIEDTQLQVALDIFAQIWSVYFVLCMRHVVVVWDSRQAGVI